MSGTDELRDQLRREMSTGVPGWRGGGDGDYWQLKVDRILALPAVAALLDAQAAVTRVQAAYENREAYQTPVALLAEIRRALVGTR